MLYNYNHAIIFSMITQRLILKTEITCFFSKNTKINVFILYYITIPALCSPDFPILYNNIEVLRSHKQILLKQLVLVKLCSLKVCKELFVKTSKVLAFSNHKSFFKKVVLIIITKDFVRIVFKKDFLVMVLHVELKIAPKKKYCKIPEISIH